MRSPKGLPSVEIHECLHHPEDLGVHLTDATRITEEAVSNSSANGRRIGWPPTKFVAKCRTQRDNA